MTDFTSKVTINKEKLIRMTTIKKGKIKKDSLRNQIQPKKELTQTKTIIGIDQPELPYMSSITI